MRRAIDHVALAVGAAIAFFTLAAAAPLWSGDLVPSPFWLATASTSLIALLTPRRLRLAVIAGGVAGNVAGAILIFDDSVRSGIGPVLGNSVETVLVVWGASRLFGDPARMAHARDAVKFIGLAVVSCAIGGLIAAADTSSNVIDDRLESWWRWTLGNAVGELHLLPLALFAGSPLFFRRSRFGRSELIASCAVVLTVGVSAFTADSVLTYLLVPAALWFAIRFGPLVATAAALSSAMAATIASGRDIGPFLEFGPEPVVDVQIFNVAIGVSAVVGGAHALQAFADQRRIEQSESRWRRLVESAFEGIGRVDRRGVVIEANPALCDILGRPRSDVENRPILELLGPGDRHRFHTHLEAFARGESSEFEAWTVDHTGGQHWLRVTTRPRADGGGLFVVADETQAHDERQQRRAIEHRLETVERDQRDQLARDLHDGPVQQLSAAIVRLAIARRTQADHPDLATAQDIVEQSVDHLRGTLGELAHGNVSIEGLAAALDTALRRLRPGDTPSIGISIDPGLHLDDTSSRTIFEIVREAAANALIHADASEVAITITDAEDHVHISVSDDGSGFEPDSDVRDGHLGLRLMRSRAQELGARLQVESAPGRGTTISLDIRRPTPTVVS